MRNKVRVIALPALMVLAAFILTIPQEFSESDIPAHSPDVVAGEMAFWAGGCASCHATPVDGKRARGGKKLLLGGGMELDTPFGIFRVPNISPNVEDGIGAWSTLDFVNAMQMGVSPTGQHYYPSFPYTSYARMKTSDVIDLKAYLDTLPPIDGQIGDHQLAFPLSVRRGIGAWKRLYFDAQPVIPSSDGDDLRERGRMLVEGAGHCGECHTPRNRFGAPQLDHWLAGAPNLDGPGHIPNITPAGKNISGWDESDIAYYLESGFTPDFDTVGGPMVAVQENLAHLPAEDLKAIAAYLKSVPTIN